jgi:hypothetical protein
LGTPESFRPCRDLFGFKDNYAFRVLRITWIVKDREIPTPNRNGLSFGGITVTEGEKR